MGDESSVAVGCAKANADDVGVGFADLIARQPDE
jgi:hypothetical protein